MNTPGDMYRRPNYPNPDYVVYPKILPYHGAIPGGLHEGKLIEVKGTVPYGADAFSVNLLTGLDPLSDRPLHISVRFNGRVVVRNHLEMNEWGPEERTGIFPFSSGREFKLMILVENTCYRIAVNSQHCWEFVHRISMDRVSSIFIEGSVDIERIEFVDKIDPYYEPRTCSLPPPTLYPAERIYPGFNLPYQPPAQRGLLPDMPDYPGTFITPGFPTTPAFPSYPGNETCYIPPGEPVCPQPGYIEPGISNLAPVYNPSIPYAYPIYGGLKPGMMIYISGRPSASAYKFALNFQEGTSPYPPPNIAFHFGVRFHSQSVVRNTRINDQWEREENLSSHFPFQQAVNFDMVIRVDHDRFMVALDGQHFLEFAHRHFPLERFDTLYIENDIVVSSIRFG